MASGLLDREIAFLDALRQAGLTVSLAEVLDSTRAMGAIDLLDREALRAAFAACGLKATEMDEKALPDTGAAVLDLSSGALEARLKALGASAGRPWRKEQKLACLAAWLALAQP